MNKLLRGLIAFALTINIFTPNLAFADTFEVTFNGNGGLYNGTDAELKVGILEDGTIGEANWPSDPVKLGYNFVGYDVEANCTTVFKEETTLTASWQAKQTTINLNADGGEGGDTSVQAIYDSTLPAITVPVKDGCNFLGYFNNDVQYYDENGNSSYTWNLEDKTFELTAHYEVVEELPLLTQVPILTATQTYRATLDLDGGSIIAGDVPTGWSLAEDNTYYKDFEQNTSIYYIFSEWGDVTIDKDGYVVNGWDYSTTWDLSEDFTFTPSYYEAVSFTASAADSFCKVDFKVNKIEKNRSIVFDGNKILDYAERVIAEATPEDGYVIDHWMIGGSKYISGSYYVTGDVTATAHTAKSYGVVVNNILVTDRNLLNVLGDGKVTYLDALKALVINGSSDEQPYTINGICDTSGELAIYTTGNVSIFRNTSYVANENVCGIYGTGTIKISSDGTLAIDAYDNYRDYVGKTIAGIYANDIVIDKGNISVTGSTYGIYAANSLTVNSTDNPVLDVYSSNTVAISVNGGAENLKLNGAYVYGSTEPYVASETSIILQDGQDGITISYDEITRTLYDLWVGGIRVTSENCNDILNNGYVSYDPITKTLTMKSGSYISGKDGYGIYCLDDLNIYVYGYCSINADSSAIYSTGVSYGIYCEGDLNIVGDNEDYLYVSASDAQTISCGIFCDGRLTISQHVEAYSSQVEFLNNETEDFCISAGVWARSGISVEGTNKVLTLLEAECKNVKNVCFNTYGILSGDGNPGYDKEATIDIKDAKVFGNVGYANLKASSYGIYSNGTITVDNATIGATINEALEDNAAIHSDADFVMTNGSVIDEDCSFGSIQYDDRKVYFIDVEGTMTVDGSSITVTDGQGYCKALTKKSHTIHATNLIVKNDANINVKGFTARDESAAIFVENKLDVQGGTIKAYGGVAGDDSYGIYAGSQLFDGSHSISGGDIYAQGNTCGEDCESIGLRTKKGDLNISGGTLELVGKTNGLNSSGVITITNDNSTHISAKADNKNAIYSKEPISLDNATIENATELYPTETTSEFIQSGSNPVIIRFKIRADISGVAMLYPEGQSSYIYGDGVWYSGDPVATNNVTKEDITNQIDEFYYEWYQKVDDEYIYINGTPFEAGEYRLVVTYYNDNYEGEQVIPFTINKKTLTVNYSGYEYVYDGEAHKPEIVFSGLLYGDVASFDEPLTYTIYDEDGNPVTNAIDVGMYEIDTTISQTDTFTVLYDGDDVTSNYEVKTGSINYDFYIFDNIYAMNNITTAMINNSLAYDCDIEPISLDEAKIIASENQALLQAINDGDEVTFYTELASVSDSHVFDEVDIDSSNSFLFSVSLYARVKGSDVIYEINNSHAKNVKISLYLVESQVEGFVGSNKNYYVYRKHNGVLNELPCELNKANEYYVFTFGNSLFSDFAIFSKNKPVNPIIHNDTHNVPNTSDIH